MKIMVIPDIHQSLWWEQYCNEHIEECDRCVFLGDYCDDWDSSSLWGTERNPIKVIEKIISFKKEHTDKVTLLLGNHDISYLNDDELTSGHQHLHHYEIKKCLKSHLDDLDICTLIDGWLFSHAGVSLQWYRNIFETQTVEINDESVKAINDKFHNGNYDAFSFMFASEWTDHVYTDPCGNNSWQSPLWIRPWSLMGSLAYNRQVVGHTEFKKVRKFRNGLDDRLICADTDDHKGFFILDTDEEYNEIEWNDLHLSDMI